jgi:pimeloyl-ACP methyl ester carboxylesterase
MTMHMRRLVLALATVGALLAAAATASARPLSATWMQGYRVPGTPAKYNKVGVLKIGPRSAKNVLVLEPGMQAGSAYFVPLAQWLVRTVKGWQVWSIERRENLFEDQALLTKAKAGKATEQQVYNYYFGYLQNPSIKPHFVPVPDSSVQFVKQWGTAVAVQDMHRVIEAAKKLGGKVVLGGHSLGGALATAYATWNFNGRPGADDLAGLVFDDGAGAALGSPITAQMAEQVLQGVQHQASPWLSAGVPAPYLGLFGSTGALAAFQEPDAPSIAEQAGLLKPFGLSPAVPATNLAVFAWNTNVPTSKLVFAFQAHIGKGLATHAVNGVYGWDGAGALTPARRWAAMLSGPGVADADGVEWYFPNRLAAEGLGTGAINNGIANPAGRVFGLRSTLGHRLPKRLLMYAFGAYGGKAITAATSQLAAQSGIPARNLTLVSRHGIYAHNDPAGAYPKNVFFDYLIRFLHKVAAQAERRQGPPPPGLG